MFSAVTRLHSAVCLSLALAVVSAVAVGSSAAPRPPGVQRGAAVDFARDIRPLLGGRCVSCHGPARQEGGLRLDVRARALAGGDAGRGIVPGAPERSELLRRLTTADPKHRMPLGGKPLAPAQIAAVRSWIAAGAPWPDALAGREGGADHWSFRPLRRPVVPHVRSAAGVRNPIDAFVLARLEARGLGFSPEASPETLIRRLYLDLLGLPPSPEEVEAFVRESNSNSNSKPLGFDPATGPGSRRGGRRAYPDSGPVEAWRPTAAGSVPAMGRPITADRVGTASTPTESAHEGRYPAGRRARVRRPSSSRAPNAGYPLGGRTPNADAAYERLVDRLLASPHFGERWGRHWLDLARFAESDGYENDQLRPNAWRYRDWVIQAFNSDMSFDRFTVEQLAGDLLPNPTPEGRIATGFHRNTLWNSAASADKEEFRTLAIKDRTDTTATAWMGLTAGCAKCHSHKYDPVSQREYYQLYAFFNRTDNEDISVPGGQAHALRAVSRDTSVHMRGGFLTLGEKVVPGTPAILPPLKPRGGEADRLDLARWLVSPSHPLTARVAANQVWMHLFGYGLVPTPENFGRSGRPPTHPELLDWLAASFAESWSTKALIRLVATSSTYRQASAYRADLSKVDPENVLLGRQNRFRVEAEIVRDLSLSVSGLLDAKLGGPSIVPPFPEGLLEQRFTNEALKLPGAERHRRGVYIHVQRTLTHPSLAAFDAADGNQACVRRDRSTTPIQALTLLNDPVFVECAQALGGRLVRLAPDRDTRLRRGFQLCLSRLPSDAEQALLVRLVEAQERLGATEQGVWNGVARALLNLEEFTTRE